jgi:hypothetical protein
LATAIVATTVPTSLSAQAVLTTPPVLEAVNHLEREIDELTANIECAPETGLFLNRRRDVGQRLYAAEQEGTDFDLIGKLGLQLDAMQAQASLLRVPEEDYYLLADRHADVVDRTTAKCKELTAAKQYAPLLKLSDKLTALKAIDTSNLPPSWSSKYNCHGTLAFANSRTLVQTILCRCLIRALQQRKVNVHYVPEAQSSVNFCSKQSGCTIYTFYVGDHLLWGKIISCSSVSFDSNFYET